MTKIHEDFIRDKVMLIKDMSENLKGELTVVLSEKIVEKNSKKEVDESVISKPKPKKQSARKPPLKKTPDSKKKPARKRTSKRKTPKKD